MNVGFGSLRKTLKEVLHQFHLKIADANRRDFCLHHTTRPSAEVNGGSRECFIHRHQEIACAQDAALRAESLQHGLAKSNAYIFNGVMLIDVEVAPGTHFQVETTMASNQIQHVIEKADSCCNASSSTAIQIDLQPDIRFVRLPMNCRCARHVQFVCDGRVRAV